MQDDRVYSPYLIIGKLSQDFILTSDGTDINDLPGGHLLYSAIGMTPWERNPLLVSRISHKFSRTYLEELKKYNFNLHGIKMVDVEIEHRNFISFFQSNEREKSEKSKSVLSEYFYAGKPFPRSLLGYVLPSKKTDSLTERTSETILSRDIPSDFLEARCIHLCPLDYLSHNLLPQVFSGTTGHTITIQAGDGYMQPYFYSPIKTLVNGLTAFIAKERQVKRLFSEEYKMKTLEDMMCALLDYGAENVVVMEEEKSFCFISRVDRKVFRMKADDSEQWDKIGLLSCFCGAYIVGLNETYDYKKAAAYGAARSSMLRNERNPFNNLNIFERLLTEKIRIMENRIEG